MDWRSQSLGGGLVRVLKTLGVAVCIAAFTFAASPIGTASSSASFELNGIPVSPQGVSPIIAGDEVRSVDAPVSIRFQDGSRLTLGEQSLVKLVRNGETLTANVVAGQAQFAL